MVLVLLVCRPPLAGVAKSGLILFALLWVCCHRQRRMYDGDITYRPFLQRSPSQLSLRRAGTPARTFFRHGIFETFRAAIGPDLTGA